MYLVRSKSCMLRMRDVGADGCPMRDVGPLKWVVFESLPDGYFVGDHDGDVSIREVVDLDSFGEDVEGYEKPKKRRPKLSEE